jgi:membrane protein implicated in regulation of membrane protease activity
MEVELYDSLKAPFESGQKAGVVKVYAGDELLAEYVATTKEGVGEGGILSIFGISDATAELIGNLTLATIGMLFLLLILYVMVKRRQVKRRRSLRQQERQILRLHKDRQKAKWEEEYWKTRL